MIITAEKAIKDAGEKAPKEVVEKVQDKIKALKDIFNHYNYIYYNPLKHGYVNNPNNWLGLWIGNEFYYWI